MSVEENVQARYSDGAKERQNDLCCPVDYQTELLQMLPAEIIEKDYGCGDPSRYAKKGDIVLDLGSGGGKICYMAAQLVGKHGHVHGVDMTDDMLELAKKYQPEMANKIGQNRVTFHKGHIQNLAFDLQAACDYVETQTIHTPAQVAEYEAWKQKQQKETPMIANDSITLVISNCVLNLVDRRDRKQLFSEIFRVLKPGGRVAISDIVSNAHVPDSLQKDPELWSGCISGAFQEKEFAQAFIDNGFVNVAYDQWNADPWRVVENIEFRSVTLIATKPYDEDSGDKTHELMYIGPHRSITDDFGNILPRAERISVNKIAYTNLMQSEHSEYFVGFESAPQPSCGDNKASQVVKAFSGSSKKGGCC